MTKFRDIKTLQKIAAVHASLHNHFNHDRHLNCHENLKQNHTAAPVERLIRWSVVPSDLYDRTEVIKHCGNLQAINDLHMFVELNLPCTNPFKGSGIYIEFH